MPEPNGIDKTQYIPQEQKGLLRAADFARLRSAYALKHATRPARIGLTVSVSPLSLLAWIAEKFLDWSDPRTAPPLNVILESVTLYWFTETFPRAIYPYRQLFTPGNIGAHENPEWRIEKPFGFSWFPYEFAPVPKAWVETTGALKWWRGRDEGDRLQLWRGRRHC